MRSAGATRRAAFVEGAAAPAPPAGSSLERLPGGAAGNGVDTNANLADWLVQAVPSPAVDGVARRCRRARPRRPPRPRHRSRRRPRRPTPTPTPTPDPDPDTGRDPDPDADPGRDPDPDAHPDADPDPDAHPDADPDAGRDADRTGSRVAGRRDRDHRSGVLTTDLGALEVGSIRLRPGRDRRHRPVPRCDGRRRSARRDDHPGDGDARDAATTSACCGSPRRTSSLGPTAALPAPVSIATGRSARPTKASRVTVAGTVIGQRRRAADGLGIDIDDGSGIVRAVVGPDALGGADRRVGRPGHRHRPARPARQRRDGLGGLPRSTPRWPASSDRDADAHADAHAESHPDAHADRPPRRPTPTPDPDADARRRRPTPTPAPTPTADADRPDARRRPDSARSVATVTVARHGHRRGRPTRDRNGSSRSATLPAGSPSGLPLGADRPDARHARRRDGGRSPTPYGQLEIGPTAGRHPLDGSGQPAAAGRRSADRAWVNRPRDVSSPSSGG